MGKSKKPYQYGKDANPTDWFQASDAINSLQPKKKSASSLYDKMASIEEFIKSQKQGDGNGN